METIETSLRDSTPKFMESAPILTIPESSQQKSEPLKTEPLSKGAYSKLKVLLVEGKQFLGSV
jgi:hypothetical protein